MKLYLLFLMTMFSFYTILLSDSGTHFIYVPGRSKHVPMKLNDHNSISSCKLCKALKTDNPHEFPLLSGQHFTVMLNLFPYSEGHLLIVANTHTKTLDALTPEQQTELITLISKSTTILKLEFKCPGINVGYNEGRCAGASVVDHFHMHICPRFEYREKSFVQAISGLEVVQWDLKELHQRLQPYFKDLSK